MYSYTTVYIYISIYHVSCSIFNSIIILNNHQHLSTSHVYAQHQISSNSKTRLLKVLKLQVNLQPSRSLPGEGMCWGPTDLGSNKNVWQPVFSDGLEKTTNEIYHIYIYHTHKETKMAMEKTWKNNTFKDVCLKHGDFPACHDSALEGKIPKKVVSQAFNRLDIVTPYVPIHQVFWEGKLVNPWFRPWNSRVLPLLETTVPV